MDWMAVIIMALALAMVIGPVLFMQPTKRQRRLAHLRAQATAMGLSVQMEKIKDETYGVYQKSWPLTGKERRKLQPWRAERMPYAHGLHLAQYWQVNNPQALTPVLREQLDSALAKVPPGVVAVEVSAAGARCFWNERGGEQTLLALAEWLDEFTAFTVPSARHRLTV